MRSFSAAALFVLAIVTECLAAQSDRSRQRSGPIRSVPLAANVKRNVDFNCPEEFGYYPHPTDCTLYYVCVFGGALLESCTGGLMYSHELQTCDWPRNVGCDGTSAAGVEELERLNERDRDPLPPPPPRRTPPPPPRAQPNPVVTSRGQPKFNRDEYDKQQQLYAEVDDLPPVEEIESDRQQRVYRGQPSTIGQVQKDRDGYGQQVVNSRTLNSNIIPASVPQHSGKIGSFSFGTQIDDRRAATATPAPQTYSGDKIETLTDSSAYDRLLDIETNSIDLSNNSKSRRKREAPLNAGLANSTGVQNNATILSDRNDFDDNEEYYVQDAEEFVDMETAADGETIAGDAERGKRQIRYYLQKGFKNPAKLWSNTKPIRLVSVPQHYYNRNPQNTKYQPNYNGLSNNNYYEGSEKPYTSEYSTANPFVSFSADDDLKSFKPSLRDPFSERFPHAGMNLATQIITKSPPISALKNTDPLASFNGGFYNNNNAAHHSQVSQNTYNDNQFLQHVPGLKPINFLTNQDSFLLPSTVVTGKPVKIENSPRPPTQYETNSEQIEQDDSQEDFSHDNHKDQIKDKDESSRNPLNSEESDEEEKHSESSEDESAQKEDDPFYKHEFPEPPYEFTHPKHRYEEIENPFADPNFDFDSFLAKLRDSHETASTSPRQQPQSYPNKKQQNDKVKAYTNKSPTQESTTARQRSSMNYDGMSTPRPFSVPSGAEGVSESNAESFYSPHNDQSNKKLERLIQPSQRQQNLAHHQQQQQQQIFSENIFRFPDNSGTPVDAIKPKLKPPNFNDDRNLPIIYNFNRPLGSTSKPHYDKAKSNTQQVFTVTQKPLIFFTSTGNPIFLSSPKQQYFVRPDKIIALQPHSYSTGKPYSISSMNPHNAYLTFKQSTSKPLTTLANEQLSALHKYWNNPTTATPFYLKSTTRPNTVSEIPKLESIFAQIIKSTPQTPTKVISSTTPTLQASSTTKSPSKRRPIPKPSPEMPDYYYDDDEEQYYYEPAVKPKYMPSSEVKPKRPPMAQNYQEYEDSDEVPTNSKPTSPKRPLKYNPYKPEVATKNQNDVSAVTKAPEKHSAKLKTTKVSIPVSVDYGTPAPNVIMRPEVSNYEVFHHPRNRTILMRRPIMFVMTGPHTAKPPKYLNQTTLRPYTVRHRLAKPTNVVSTLGDNDMKLMRGRMRHHNIVAQMKLTTPRDNHKQETRFTKTKHDDKTNSLEPTESVTPTSYSASPRPKMLYNGSQTYTPDQYDPYYAVYDEDGELYKDTDYVQQYNTASLRPAVQQTYRGTPPPARRPVESYTSRPTQVDYDDALIHGQINNQNQYQSTIRQSTRGEGNELGYDRIPSSVKTTLYEATSISTTPSTTSTSTTLRSTTAPFTEAMTPSRYTPRSSTDENPNRAPESLSENPNDGSNSPTSSTSSPINFSALAKPFEKTDNTYRLKETLTSTEKFVTKSPIRLSNNIPVDVVQPIPNKDGKNVVSLTSGFSIRRNPNKINSPYTLTVLTRPLESYNRSRKIDNNWNVNDAREESVESQEDAQIKDKNVSARRNDASQEIESSEHNTPIYVRPMRAKIVIKPRINSKPTQATIPSTKYILKTVIKRPAPFTTDDEQKEESTENIVNTDALIETALLNARNNGYLLSPNKSQQSDSNKWDQYRAPGRTWDDKTALPYRSLDGSRNDYRKEDKVVKDHITSTASNNRFAPLPSRDYFTERPEKEVKPSKSYYSYSVFDEKAPGRSSQVFSSTVKNIIQAFFGNFAPSPSPKAVELFSTTPKTEIHEPEEKVVNIGFQKKMLKFTDEKPLQNNFQRLQILTEPSYDRYGLPRDTFSITEANNEIDQRKEFSTTSTTTSTTPRPFSYIGPNTTPTLRVNLKENDHRYVPNRDSFQSKFSSVVSSSPEITKSDNNNPENKNSQKFLKIISKTPSTDNGDHEYSNNNNENEVTKLTRAHVETTTTATEHDWVKTNKIPNDIASTTSTTKLTTTQRLEQTSTTKSLTFPTRATRVNPAIKLAATNPGGGRRSYQSSSKCATDDSLQANPKCNEIKYQRPSSPTRGRGSAHYTLSQGEAPQQQSVNRGTPPTRNRPTLKPSTSVVTNPHPIIDIYNNPPRRPAPVYPQPTPDKTAAKCRKDVCLLPDCYCGGKDIPGDLPVESLPQIVLLTFDDSVNDLNKGLYADLFEKGRVNPNGCPISATFYVSHEWTDYSQVQNLYSAGHEMASHTISHSFGEQFSQKKWNREVAGQREILAAYGGVKLEDVRGMRAPFLSVGGNKMFKMLYDSNFTYDSSLPVYENRPPSWPYTLDYKLFHDCMIPPCPTKSYPGVWEVPMVMWQDLNGGRCSMGDACANPPEAEGVYKMLLKNFDRHYTTNRAPFGLFYHAAWFTQPHHKAGFIMFLDFINQMPDVWIVTNWQALQWVRDPTPISRLNNFQPFQCNYQDRPKKCNNPKVCNLWHKSGVRYMRTCQPCPEIYPWTGKSGIKSSRIDNDIEE